MQSEETPNRPRGDERRQVLIIFAMRISAEFCHFQTYRTSNCDAGLALSAEAVFFRVRYFNISAVLLEKFISIFSSFLQHPYSAVYLPDNYYLDKETDS